MFHSNSNMYCCLSYFHFNFTWEYKLYCLIVDKFFCIEMNNLNSWLQYICLSDHDFCIDFFVEKINRLHLHDPSILVFPSLCVISVCWQFYYVCIIPNLLPPFHTSFWAKNTHILSIFANFWLLKLQPFLFC